MNATGAGWFISSRARANAGPAPAVDEVVGAGRISVRRDRVNGSAIDGKREPRRAATGCLILQNHGCGDVVCLEEASVRPPEKAKRAAGSHTVAEGRR